jgi:hypothetical protein
MIAPSDEDVGAWLPHKNIRNESTPAEARLEVE